MLTEATKKVEEVEDTEMSGIKDEQDKHDISRNHHEGHGEKNLCPSGGANTSGEDGGERDKERDGEGGPGEGQGPQPDTPRE